jgi:hypothetical protein
MKHAGEEALERPGLLLAELRERSQLREPRPGVFYLKSRAFLHFHEDPRGLFADVKLTDDFARHPVNTEKQRANLLARIDRHLARH